MLYLYAKSFILKFLFLIVLLGCRNPNSSNTSNKKLSSSDSILTMPYDSKFAYNLEAPNDKFKLSKELKEISGLTCYKDKWLAAVQDEKGAIYLIDMQTGDTEDIIEFAADGDYEGIACVKETFYTLRADGVLFQIKHWKGKQKRVRTKVIDTNLGEVNDTEGLAFDPVKNRLLIACKASAAIGDKVTDVRAIYTYDLKKNKFELDPTFLLSRKAFKKYIKENLEEYPSYKVYLKEIKKAKKSMLLEPSAIAIHPVTNEFYLLSAVSNSLVVLDRSFNIKHLKRLDAKRFEQPEGITFNSRGDLFIASEGLKNKARVYKFDYLP
ncbi:MULTISPECIES: SdiA-regulated domain-containing protein [unclassified Aureispira]|uniref:SdiA-regulated domain-containing protein n=1 Tax=unclassified Aureispira TaxID=2649989 RepID=UPI000696AC4F|nr:MULTISPECIES: SdiA-regulated domain-containing protein [unclassified Aureispira]WMX15880.1 SdiA-regulated domain-containing protein [Aureispira sp. CCB-E]